jgi:hypothetical protein
VLVLSVTAVRISALSGICRRRHPNQRPPGIFIALPRLALTYGGAMTLNVCQLTANNRRLTAIIKGAAHV